MKAPKTIMPAAPDPVAAAQAQTASNVDTAIANSYMQNANETSPYGSVSYKIDGMYDVNGNMVPQWSRTVSLSPVEQQKLDQQNQAEIGMNNLANSQISRLNNILGAPIDLSRLPTGGNMPTSAPQYANFGGVAGPQLSVGPTDFSADRQKVEDALYARLNPQLERDRAARSAELASQGIAPGSEAYREAMGLLDRQANDARMQVITAGGDEQSRLAGLAFQKFGLENEAQGQNFNQAFQKTSYRNDLAGRSFSDRMSLAQAQDTARERALQEQLLPRNQAINEISALLNGGQVNMPQFTEYRPGTVANTPIGDYIYNSAAITANGIQQRNQAKQSAYSANLSGLYGLGSAALSAGAYMYGGKK